MTENTDTTTGTVLTGDEATAVRQAFAAFPFGADPRVYTPSIHGFGFSGDLPVPVADVVAAIGALSEVIRDYSDRAEADKSDHLALRRDVAAMRRLLGADPS